MKHWLINIDASMLIMYITGHGSVLMFRPADIEVFLDQLTESGKLNCHTAGSRKRALRWFVRVLTDEEKDDIRAIDVDKVVDRFYSVNQDVVATPTLAAYKSRFLAALNGYLRTKQSPGEFVPRISKRRGRKNIESQSPSKPMDVISMRLRPNTLVHIANLPFDITPEEARRIANLVLAHASDEKVQSISTGELAPQAHVSL